MDGRKNVSIFLLVGAKQKTLPLAVTLFMQENLGQLRVIATPVEGRNALDFVLVFELGKIFSQDPYGYFHIVSKDTDFDSVVRHVKAEKRLISRWESMAAIPTLATEDERFARLRAELGAATNRPKTRNGLHNKIRSYFCGASDAKTIEKTIAIFVSEGLLSFTETDRVLYSVA